jgi:uncharacterized membrane protein
MTKRTDKKILERGLKIMGLTLIFMFLGPTLLYIAFSNEEKPLYVPILIFGLIICAAAIYFGFRGIKTIMDSMFKSSNLD